VLEFVLSFQPTPYERKDEANEGEDEEMVSASGMRLGIGLLITQMYSPIREKEIGSRGVARNEEKSGAGGPDKHVFRARTRRDDGDPLVGAIEGGGVGPEGTGCG
jgi:hypothetical protein